MTSKLVEAVHEVPKGLVDAFGLDLHRIVVRRVLTKGRRNDDPDRSHGRTCSMTVLYLRFVPRVRRIGIAGESIVRRCRRGSTMDDLFGPERSGGLVEPPSGHVFRKSVDDTRDHVRQPARRTGSVVLGGSGGMVRMAVVDPDEIEVFLSHIVVNSEELEGIDHVSPRPVLRRDVPGPAGFHHAPRSARMA